MKKQHKLRRKTGYTLAESLIAILLIALISMGLATGVAFGVRQYNNSVTRSEARILCSTLTSVITDELSSIQGSCSKSESGNTVSYHSERYGVSGELKADGGHICIGDTKLIPDAAYSTTMQLRAAVEVTPSPATAGSEVTRFTVRLTIQSPDRTSVYKKEIETTFDVIPLNTVTLSS